MKKPLFRNEDSVVQQKVTRPGSDKLTEVYDGNRT